MHRVKIQLDSILFVERFSDVNVTVHVYTANTHACGDGGKEELPDWTKGKNPEGNQSQKDFWSRLKCRNVGGPTSPKLLLQHPHVNSVSTGVPGCVLKQFIWSDPQEEPVESECWELQTEVGHRDGCSRSRKQRGSGSTGICQVACATWGRGGGWWLGMPKDFYLCVTNSIFLRMIIITE